MGTTPDVNNISIDEALAGRVKRTSELPATLPEATKTDVNLEAH